MKKNTALFSFLLFTMLCFIPFSTMAQTTTPTNKNITKPEKKHLQK